MIVDQYQVVIVNLDPTIGREIKKTRPCVIISPDEMNHNLQTVVVAPLTSTKRNYPTRTSIKIDRKVSQIALDQIRTIDKKRIITIGPRISTKESIQVKLILKKTYID